MKKARKVRPGRIFFGSARCEVQWSQKFVTPCTTHRKTQLTIGVRGHQSSNSPITHICNYNHGAFLSGDRLLTRQEAFNAWLSKHSEDYLQELSERVSEDIGAEVFADQRGFLIDDFLKPIALPRDCLS